MIYLAAASAGLNMLGQIGSFLGAGSAAKAANRHAQETVNQQAAYRDELLRYQNETWAQDISYAGEVLEYSRGEFARQQDWVGTAQAAVTRNRDADAFELMLQGVENNIASTFAMEEIAKGGRAARASMRATERGVEGASVEAVIGDVIRQEGEAAVMVDLNRVNTNRGLYREGQQLDARADQQLYEIASGVRTLAPSTPIRAPSPVAPVQAPMGQAAPSPLGLAMGLASSAVGGFNTYNTLSGSNAAKTMDTLSNWASRKFSIGGT